MTSTPTELGAPTLMVGVWSEPQAGFRVIISPISPLQAPVATTTADRTELRKLEALEHYVGSTPRRSDYWIYMNPTNGSFVASFLDPARAPWHGEYPTLEAAQLACQQHHVDQVMCLIDSQEKARNG